MTDYNDGKWHGWNGGECPVHPKSVVDVRHEFSGSINGSDTYTWNESHTAKAGWFNKNCWLHHNADKRSISGDNPIIAFRVVTPYVEPVKPREFWITTRGSGVVENPGRGWRPDGDWMLVREVIEE